MSNAAIAKLTPSALSELYESCLRAVDADGVATWTAIRFTAWLADHWRVDLGREPARPPDAVSYDRRGVPLIRWYATTGSVCGWPLGAGGCYEIPTASTAPNDDHTAPSDEAASPETKSSKRPK